MPAKKAAHKQEFSQNRAAVLCTEQKIAEATAVENIESISIAAESPTGVKTLLRDTKGESTVTPFLKWAGGKSNLLKKIRSYYPFGNGTITKYAEPFVGSGSVLFDILSHYNLKEIYIGDINTELINAYCVVCDHIDELIEILYTMQNEYWPLDTDMRKKYYWESRNAFNTLKLHDKSYADIQKAALMIFLNKTCFNGLYRVNRKGEFNVPIGSYKRPPICNEKNLRTASEKLQGITIVCDDYSKSATFIDKNTFVYLDPPYRPITNTANFTAYTQNLFIENDQIKLASFFNEMDKKGAKILLSNSDPKHINADDNFFDDIYSAYRIERVDTKRMISCKGESRGNLVGELLISNY